MIQRHILRWMMGAATALASCSQGVDVADEAPEDNHAESTVQTIQFSAYVDRTTTRAGMAGVLDNSALHAGGFGVLAYHTDDKVYNPLYQPNFMYNTQVTYNDAASVWTYSPVRLWPNETGSNAVSDGVDRLTFFAYAPWVDVNQATGFATASGEGGIVGLTPNTGTGDPFVLYHVSLNPSQQVDFCWGVANTALTASADASLPNSIAAGQPYVDVVKPATGTKLDFNFRHALAALNVQVDTDVDVVNAHDAATSSDDHDKAPSDGTRIYIRQVKFEGFEVCGTFNLNTPADRPTWYDMSGTAYISDGGVTIYDGRTDGLEAVSAAVNELPAALNPVLVQSAPYGDASLPPGGTNTAVNLFASTLPTAPVYVIPTGRPLRVTIVYDVETVVPWLSGYLADGTTHGTSTETRVACNVALNGGQPLTLEAGKLYFLRLHLGLTSVSLDATMSDIWVGYHS